MTFTAANLCQLYQTALLQSAKDKPEKEVSRVFCTDDKYEVLKRSYCRLINLLSELLYTAVINNSVALD